MNSVTSGEDGQTVVATEVVTVGGTPVTAERRMRIASDGSLHLDPADGVFFPVSPEIDIPDKGDDVVIPSLADLEAGRTSSGTTYTVEEGTRYDITYSVRGAGREQVTVPAGTVEAYVVEMEFELESSDGIVTADGTNRYWIVPGFGVVRQEFGEFGTAELVSSSVALP